MLGVVQNSGNAVAKKQFPPKAQWIQLPVGMNVRFGVFRYVSRSRSRPLRTLFLTFFLCAFFSLFCVCAQLMTR
jgi:hypothetical protein